MPLLRFLPASLVVTAVAAVGCANVIALDDLRRASGSESPAGAADAAAPSSGGSGASTSGSSSGGASSTSASPGDPSCGDHPGSPMTRLTKGAGSFCVDTTQVTGAEYTVFLAAAHPGPPPLPDGCAPHPDFHPGSGWSGSMTDPVTFVDWCDAAAYCAWAGKRLCGKLGGGSLSGESDGEWSVACDAGVLAAATAGDWENGCSSRDGDDACTVRGAACDERADRDPLDPAADVGIRCCAP